MITKYYRVVEHNLKQARFNLQELSGSLGDLGTFLPLLVGMVTTNGLDFASALFFAGLFNLLTACLFPIPMAVQPMKAIAAVAITEGLTVSEILAAGAIVSAVVLILGLSGLIDVLNRFVTKSVVRGLQVALGLSLAIRGFQLIQQTGVWFGSDSYLTALGCGLMVVMFWKTRLVPVALLLFCFGCLLVVLAKPEAYRAISLGLTLPQVVTLSKLDFVNALPRAALPQIPLTTLNSVIAVCALATELFAKSRTDVRSVALSVGLMNLSSCWFGGMPMCHGAGGLAGQYRFGARTNGSILMLGGGKILLAIFFGATLMTFCQNFPISVLGVLLLFAGLELASVCRDQTNQNEATVMLFTAAACLGMNHLALGFLLGLALAWCLRYISSSKLKTNNNAA